MSGKYILSIDQSTQGTKALLLNESGKLLGRTDIQHRQIVDKYGRVSHSPEEIYENTVKAARLLIERYGIDKRKIACMGISNQRETSLAWDKETGSLECSYRLCAYDNIFVFLLFTQIKMSHCRRPNFFMVLYNINTIFFERGNTK